MITVMALVISGAWFAFELTLALVRRERRADRAHERAIAALGRCTEIAEKSGPRTRSVGRLESEFKHFLE